ncbi:hypothetical protein ACHHYP_12055 [Achlya hypogyna]|uniref:Major Facilitator Superfamily (MFS) n=1 Tax=Achlya hypogyna TaxID=1202772 RepID=A0A1V9YHR0_ACHHY|nr:hypothetical protein ACHHYP_12055 [Achlya hypogyna]
MRATPYELQVATPLPSLHVTPDDAVTNPEMDDRLPPTPSLGLILVANFLFNVSFYIIVPTATLYSRSLGASDLYSGLVIGGITLTSAASLVPLNNVACFRDYYQPPLDLAAGTMVLGHLLYAFANVADSLALLLLGRLVNGLGFTGWLFVKRYCTDPRIVGFRRRTMCANLLVAAQTLGMVCGPLAGSLLSRLETSSRIWTGYTAPGFVMALLWLLYWVTVRVYFNDAPPRTSEDLKNISNAKLWHLDAASLRSLLTMAVASFVIFFVLGAWEADIPLATDELWGWSSFSAGVLLAVGGLVSFALILPFTMYTKRIQDRAVLATALSLALVGAVMHQSTVGAPSTLTLGGSWFFVCWGMNLDALSDKAAIVIQLSNYSGRLTGAVWGTAASSVGGEAVVGWLNLGVNALSLTLLLCNWRVLLAHTG